MVAVIFTIHGDFPEAGLKHSLIYNGDQITLSTIQKLFPFDGTFHFRKRYSDMWMDIVDPVENLLITPFSNSLIENLEIQALVLNIDYTDDDQDDAYLTYLNAVEMELSRSSLNEDNRHTRVQVGIDTNNRPKEKTRPQQVKDATKSNQPADVISLESAAKTATSIWNTVKSTASNIQKNITQTSSKLSDLTEENLAELSEDLTANFSDLIPKHICELSDLWNALFPGIPVQRNSSKWKEAGFQNTDPTVDLRTSGILSLRSLRFLCERYPDRAQSMLQANKANISSNYPFAVVAINVTLMLADIIGLKDQKYLSLQSNYWELFENKNSFFEIFCICFLYMDKIWTSRKAVRSDFGKLMSEVKSAIVTTLSRSPKFISDLKTAAAQTGMC